MALSAQKGDILDVFVCDLRCETSRSVHHRCGRAGCLVVFNNNKDFKFYVRPNLDVSDWHSHEPFQLLNEISLKSIHLFSH